MAEKEIWKDVVGYEGVYQVSNLGRVKRIGKYTNQFGNAWSSNRILKGSEDKDGYLNVTLSKNGLSKKHKIHRLVAQAFIANPKKYPLVNHKDENKKNNDVINLEWCDYQYNSTYGKMMTMKNIEVTQLTVNGQFVKQWNSAKEAADMLKIDRSHICKCCKGKSKTAYGYQWKYKEG